MSCRWSSFGVVVAGLFALAPGAHAQTTWIVDSKSSLAWWQINPHLNHLWATTCPAEPSWRPGEGRSAGWFIHQFLPRPPNRGDWALDSINVPLYPRYEARDVCTDAVRGLVLVADTVTWRGVRGAVSVLAAQLVSGLDQRDLYTREAILEVARYPEIRFTIDSLVGVTRQADTLTGSVVGVFSLHGVDKPMTAFIRAWPEAGGQRVLAKMRTPALAIVREYGLSRVALGLGIGTAIWKDLYMGVDIVLRPEGPQSH